MNLQQTRIRPFLMFEGKAEEAINFYVSLFPGSRILSIVRYGAGQPGPEGSVMKAEVAIADQTILFTDSFVKHAFTFTPSMSFFVTCNSEQEIRDLSSALAAGGSELMPLGSYGFSRQFAWVNDRFGVSWQLNLD
jgi:predicted 3-demethylubiquinone-9 3-methyltransferase (glyoxalase superfamily)